MHRGMGSMFPFLKLEKERRRRWPLMAGKERNRGKTSGDHKAAIPNKQPRGQVWLEQLTGFGEAVCFDPPGSHLDGSVGCFGFFY